MSRKLALIFLAIVLSGLPACSQSSDCFRKDVFCAALVTDTRGLNDFGINHDTWTGLTQAKADGVVNRIDYIESVDSKDYEKNINFFVKAGYDVIVTSGAGMRDATLHNANLHPDTRFVGMNQTDDENRTNFVSVTFPEDQMGFFAGALAAHLSKTGFVGAVCETSGIDAMWRYCEGFRAGAKYVNKHIRLVVVYRDSGSSEKLFLDDQWGAENAQKLIRDGADVIFAVGGATEVGALRAATEAGIRVIGAERDQGAALTAAGDQGSGVVTSVIGRASFTIQELMRRIKVGNLSDADMSPIGYVPFDSVASQSLVDEMNSILNDLSTRAIKTNVPLQKP